MYAFSKMKSSCHPFQIQIFHAYCIEALSKTGTEFMLKVFSLISDLFMAQCNSFLLLLIILTAFLTSGQLSLFPCKLFLCIPIEHRLIGLPPFVTLVCVYFLGLAMTEVLSNNAVAVLLTPIAIALAKSLGHDPRAYVVAVMFSATVAFATPIGYQTHMMVYGPGGYKFSDFIRVGVPLDIITGIVACLTNPLFWPL